LGGGGGSSPRCLRVFSITGLPDGRDDLQLFRRLPMVGDV
jgi:hypothetical protein